ncbi:hypothetical protein [Comamonas sp. JC664]|uniref:hypothetical protein n=1 Tax=Comamonas sp. JC664 TaxID=2801917 RepID=UPI00361B6122
MCPLPRRRPAGHLAHLLAQGAEKQLGTITVANKPGPAGGATGATLVAQAKPRRTWC